MAHHDALTGLANRTLAGRPAGPGAGARPAAGRHRRHALHRPAPLRAADRCARPGRRRCGAAGGGAAAAALRAADRHRRPDRRRPLRHPARRRAAAAGRHRPGAPGAGGAGPAAGPAGPGGGGGRLHRHRRGAGGWRRAGHAAAPCRLRAAPRQGRRAAGLALLRAGDGCADAGAARARARPAAGAGAMRPALGETAAAEFEVFYQPTARPADAARCAASRRWCAGAIRSAG